MPFVSNFSESNRVHLGRTTRNDAPTEEVLFYSGYVYDGSVWSRSSDDPRLCGCPFDIRDILGDAFVRILGISAFYHDSAAALIENGQIVAAAQEERFTRKKHDSAFPAHAVRYCLEEGDVNICNVDHVVFYEKPLLKFERLLETYHSFAPRGLRSFSLSMPLWLREKLFQKRVLIRELKRLAPNFDPEPRLLFAEHHQSHAASAFYPSPFDNAVILTMDGVGEWTTASVGLGRGNSIQLVREQRFPHSLGLLYSAFTYYTGFKVNSGEYKVMGLAPYGEPRFSDAILRQLIDLKPDGTFEMDQSYFDYCTGLTMITRKFEKLMGGPPRRPTDPLEQRHMDLAASIQAVTEEVMLRLTRSIADEFKQPNLCLAGGVALNCVANGKILRDGTFDRIWIQPAAGDAGGSLGAALTVYYDMLGEPRQIDGARDGMRGAYLGPSFSQTSIEARLTSVGAVFVVLNEKELIDLTVESIVAGHAVGWMQGRMEFGPRALGARSILGDPRSPLMQKLLNLKVKYRESFRPFAPAILREDLADWFDLDCDSPYMLLVADIAQQHRRQMTRAESCLFGIDKLNVPRSSIPAVTHVDYSARVQTVHQDTNPVFHKLLSSFKAKTGCPVLVNTSFNVRGEPIVCSPEEAFACFMGTEMEVLVVGKAFLRKAEQTVSKTLYASALEPD